MTNSKLINLLQQLNPKEHKQFTSYLSMDFTGSNELLLELYEAIMTVWPDLDGTGLDKQRIGNKIFGKGKHTDKRLNNCMSNLYLLLEDFLCWKKINQNEGLKRQLITQVFLERELSSFAEKSLKRLDKSIINSTDRSFEFYAHQYESEELQDEFLVSRGLRGYNERLQAKNNALDLYYWINKFRIACDMASRNRVVQAQYQCHFWSILKNEFLANSYELKAHPVLNIYYLTHQMLTDSSEDIHYYILKEQLEKAVELFPKPELNNIYKYLLNYCVRKINIGEENYYNEILDLYKVLLKNKIIYYNGYLSQWTFINIITAGIRLQEYEWTEQFIYDHRKFLLPEERQNVFKYSMSTLHFEKSEYLEALQYLNNVEFTDASYHLRAKIIQLKSYFELEEDEAMLSLIDAFQKFLSRSKTIPDYQKRANNNFLKYTKLLYKLRLQKDLIPRNAYVKRFQQVEQKMNQLEPLANKKWLKASLRNLME
ncbi:MAG: hypothetical protein AAFO07_15725 [Bacteroidota bacterium]